MQIKLLCIGDLVARPGRQALEACLPGIVKDHEIDCVILNAENTAGGSGLTPGAYEKLLQQGVHLFTMGDHIYRKREIIDTLSTADRIVRPANLSSQAAGKEWAVYTTAKGIPVAVISLMGRMFMPIPSDNPFQVIKRVLEKLPAGVKIIVVDMHAEATSEKVAMGRYLDGQVSVVFGTHTHVATADETILPKGTAYITDVGMTGPHDSVLGRSTDRVLKSLTTQMPYTYTIATSDLRINGIVVTVDSNTGRASRIERVCRRIDTPCPSEYDSLDGKGTDYQNSLP